MLLDPLRGQAGLVRLRALVRWQQQRWLSASVQATYRLAKNLSPARMHGYSSKRADGYRLHGVVSGVAGRGSHPFAGRAYLASCRESKAVQVVQMNSSVTIMVLAACRNTASGAREKGWAALRLGLALH